MELPEWLRARGLKPGWGWMVFHRGVESPPAAETSLRLVEVDTADEAMAFGRVVRLSHGLREAIEPRLAGLTDAGWLCWLAFDGDEPAGAAAFVAEGAAYLSFVGTLPEHRGKGAAERLARCAHQSCR